jgi:putrescine aminotransferase
MAAIDVTIEEGLPARASERGAQLVAGLAEVQRAHPNWVGDVRGKGLMVGVEFTQDDVGELVVAGMVRRGVIAAYTLNNPRVIRMEPPLIVSAGDVDNAVNAFAEAVAETGAMLEELL